MKLLGGLLFMGVLALAAVVPAKASAQAPKYNTQLEVTGVVLPAQHVVVDEQGIIMEIMSNTTKDVAPKVYRNSIAQENRIDMSPEIYEQYRQIVPEGHSKVGALYKRPPGAAQYVPIESLQRTRIPSYALPQDVLGNL